MSAISLAALMGFLGVALGAFGAHGLKNILAANDALAIWQTAVFYHLVHAVASLATAASRPLVTWLWTAGIMIFSGSLYVMALTNMRWLGWVTPVGGIFFLAGWAMLIKPRKL